MLFLKLRSIPYFLFLYFLFSYTILYIAIRNLLKQIRLKFQLHIKYLSLYAILAIGVLFFCTTTPNETWFWFTSSTGYFWSTIAFFFALGTYLKIKKNVPDYFIIIISLLFIGGSIEPITALTGLCLTYQIINKKNRNINIVWLSILSIAFLINYLSPGTTFRDKITPSLSLLDWVLYVGYGSLKYLLFNSYKTFIPALFFAIPFYLLGKKSNYLKEHFNPKKELFNSLIGISVVIVINQAIVITALGGPSPDRATISSSIFIAIVLIRFLFLLGIHHKKQPSSFRLLLALNVLVLLIFNIVFFNVHKSFSNKYDERIQLIYKNSTKDIIKVNALPFSGYLYNSELKKDPDYFVNKHLKSGLGIESDLVLEN